MDAAQYAHHVSDEYSSVYMERGAKTINDTMFKLNPLFYIVQGYRDSFLNGPWFWQYDTMSLYFWVFTLLLLIIGSKVYNRLSPHFSDVL